MSRTQVLVSNSAEELRASLADLSLRSDAQKLAFSFASYQLIDDSLLNAYNEFGLDVFGSATDEEIADDQLLTGSIVSMIMELPEGSFQSRAFNTASAHGLGKEIADWAVSTYKNPIVLMLVGGGGISIDVDNLLEGFFSEHANLPVFGGLSSSGGELQNPPLFDRQTIYTDGVLAYVFDNDVVDMRGVAISGWLEIGTPKRITKSEGNKVYEIEGIPAADFYEKYFTIRADVTSELLTASEYPIGLMREDGVRLMRAAAWLDQEDGSVSYGGSIPEGSLVRFCSPNIVETIQHTVKELQHFRSSIPDFYADGILLFDCAVRSRSFGIYMRRELQVIKELWQTPIAGFCSWGEIGNQPGQSCAFHNTVISMVLISSKQSKHAEPQGANLTEKQVAEFVNIIPEEASLESLKKEIAELRRQKTILSNFLHLTSEDLVREQEKSDELLLNILPTSIADRLKENEKTIADAHSEVTILFADLVGFTQLSSRLDAPNLVQILNRLFSSFDEYALKCRVEKIKTIGDSYMAVAGLPEASGDHAERALKLARGIQKILTIHNEKFGTELKIRIGLNSGPVVAGVIGKHKFSYDLWGDAVNTASRMESHGEPGRIHVSSSTYQKLKERVKFEKRAEMQVKGKGTMQTYFVKS